MNSCINCGAEITCGCQERIASDGKKICTNCIALYEQQLVHLRNASNATPYENTPS
jgi:hypothetical protein